MQQRAMLRRPLGSRILPWSRRQVSTERDPWAKALNSLMKLRCTMNRRWATSLAMIMLGLGVATLASAIAQPTHPIVSAIIRGDCGAAVKLLNPVVTSNDDQTSFLGGRMLDEGICVKTNQLAAAHFYERAAGLGDKIAALDYAATVGLGI